MEILKQMTKSNIELTGLDEKVKYTNLEVAIECLEWVSHEPNLDGEDRIHVYPSDFAHPFWHEFFSTLHKTHSYFRIVLDHFNLELVSSTENILVFSKK